MRRDISSFLDRSSDVQRSDRKEIAWTPTTVAWSMPRHVSCACRVVRRKTSGPASRLTGVRSDVRDHIVTTKREFRVRGGVSIRAAPRHGCCRGCRCREATVSIWGTIFAAGYDRFMAGTEKAGLSAHREALLAKAVGRVLEIGTGTGANLPFYRDSVVELILSEPSEPMARRLERRLAGPAIPVRVLRAPAEAIPLAERTIDVVVSTLALCSVADPTRALVEVRRVLKPEGLLLFIEHVRSGDPTVAAWQDRLRRPWAWFGRGCQTNRRTLELIRAAGFTIHELNETELPKAPWIVRPLVVGSAVARS